MVSILLIAALIAFVVPVGGRWGGGLQGVLSGRVWIPTGAAFILTSMVWMLVETGIGGLVSVAGVLSGLALLVSIGWMVLRRRPQMESLRWVLMPLSVLLLLAAVSAPTDVVTTGTGPLWFKLHVLLILLGLAGLALSFALSAVYLVVRRRLKRKELRGIGRLPSLESLDRLNFRTMGLGFVALTGGIAMGLAWAVAHPDQPIRTDFTVWATAAVWLWYATGLHTRLVVGWRGRTAAVFGVVGFAGLASVLAMAGLLLGRWHGFGA